MTLTGGIYGLGGRKRADMNRSLSFGVMHRLPHCYPDTAIQYKEWTIPPNVGPPPKSFTAIQAVC